MSNNRNHSPSSSLSNTLTSEFTTSESDDGSSTNSWNSNSLRPFQRNGAFKKKEYSLIVNEFFFCLETNSYFIWDWLFSKSLITMSLLKQKFYEY